MKAIVTGGSGFLGRSVVDALFEKQWDVTVIDNNSRGKSELLNTEVKFKKIDIRDQEKVIESTIGADLLVHLAFINGTRYFYEKPDLVIEVGIKGMLNVHEAVKQNNIPSVVMFSTSETYQGEVTIPTPENIALSIPDILNPRFSYGGSKIALELMTVHLTSKYVDSWKIIRPHNIYGPNMGSEHVIPQLFQKVIESTGKKITIEGSGSQTRSFCHIKDFATSFKLIMEDEAKNEIYNIGTSEEITISELATRIIKVVGKEIDIETSELPAGGTMRRCPDITKIKKLGFKQAISLDYGLQDYYKSLV
jgi:nucleoside-diphosphate-sugar epimerase